jgi:capsular polysaccharide biosynthesis protein
MSQQALDLRKSLQIVRQHKILMSIVVALGFLAGAAYGVLKPPMSTSTALIALPSRTVQPATSNSGSSTAGNADPFTATQVVVVGSYQVLAGALPHIRPAISVPELRRYIQIGTPSPDIVSVTATGKNAASAETIANAVAKSYIYYVNSPSSAVGQITAHLLAPASSATVPSKTGHAAADALLGGLAGLLIGFVVALAIGRNDRRLKQRDEIANSIGIPVLASVPAARPTSATGWTRLFESYKPTARHSWQLLTALEQLGMDRPSFGRPGNDEGGSSRYDSAAFYQRDGGGFSLAVVSLSTDPGALALGPQLAVFAASQGIATSLVIGPQQATAATASLRIACSAQLPEGSRHRGLLRVTAYEEGRIDQRPETAFVIVVAVLDSRAPEMPATMRTNATVMGVSAGVATAEQLARTAVVASANGLEITGILVANPLETDQTTGRIPRLPRPTRPRLPNRLRGVVTESRR